MAPLGFDGPEKIPLMMDGKISPYRKESTPRELTARQYTGRIYRVIKTCIILSFLYIFVTRIQVHLVPSVIHHPVDTIIAHPNSRSHKEKDICMTPECIHAASEILYNLSPSYEQLDPCTDFEELVCGGWRDRHDLRPDQGDAFTGTIMSETSETLLRHILEAPYPKSSKVSLGWSLSNFIRIYHVNKNLALLLFSGKACNLQPLRGRREL
jgi:hypothetical protein